MKFATIVLLAIALVGSAGSLTADDPAGAGEIALAYIGRSVCPEDPAKPCICFVYYTFVRGLDQEWLFNGKVEEKNARLVWVSEFFMQELPAAAPFQIMRAPAGTATIYFSEKPGARDLNHRSTLGVGVADFVRKEGLSVYNSKTDAGTFTCSADLMWSQKVMLSNGKEFNLRDLIPNGMICTEAWAGDSEVGTCTAISKK